MAAETERTGEPCAAESVQAVTELGPRAAWPSAAPPGRAARKKAGKANLSKKEKAARYPSPAAASLALWFLLLAFGGGCLSLYYARINYLPEIAWEESLTYLAVLSIIGGGLVLLFALLAFVPGAIWSESLIWDCGLNLRYQRDDKVWEPCVRKVSSCIGLPFALFMFLVHLAYWRVNSTLTIIGLAVPSLAASSYWFLHRLRLERKECIERDHHPDRDSRTAKYLTAFVTSAALGLISLMLIRRLFPAPGLGMQIFCTIMVVSANLLVSLLYRQQRWAAISAGVIVAFLLLAVGEAIEKDKGLLSLVLQKYGVGGQPRATLIVEKKAGRWLAMQRVAVEWGPGMDEPSIDLRRLPDDALARVKDVAFLSRLGKNYLLRQGDLRFSLPKELIVSWSEPVTLPAAASAGREGSPKTSRMKSP